MAKFKNARYEYTTREYPWKGTPAGTEEEARLEADGWRRAWADNSLEGIYVVYRRERAKVG